MSASATSGTRRPRMVATPAPPMRSSVTDSPLARTISSIAERGMAKCWLPIDTVSAGMMVSVSGTRSVMRVPAPGLLSTSTMPPMRSTLERTTSMPTPRPEMAVTSLGGRQPGLEDQRQLLARRQLGGVGLGRCVPAASAFSTSFLPSMPRPSSWMSIRIWLPDWRAETRQDADLALAGLQPFGRRLDAVIDRVADDVGQGIADHLDHLAIELDVAALDIDQHLLAELGRQVADHARQRDEQILDPLHAGAGDRVAHFGDDRRTGARRRRRPAHRSGIRAGGGPARCAPAPCRTRRSSPGRAARPTGGWCAARRSCPGPRRRSRRPEPPVPRRPARAPRSARCRRRPAFPRRRRSRRPSRRSGR